MKRSLLIMLNKLSRLACAIGMAMLFVCPAFAQAGAIEGTVTGRDGAPVRGALIRLDRIDIPGHYSVITVRTGHFIFPRLPLGTFNVICNVEGNDVDAVNRIRTEPNITTTVDFDLRAIGKGQEQQDKGSGPAPARTPVVPLRLPGTYVNAQTPTDQLQLNADNSFSLHEAGQTYRGTFAANSNTLELNIRDTNTKTTATIQGNALTDSGGQKWVLREQSAGTAPVGPMLKNEDIVKMAKAGLDDALIIAKIGSSKCQFDTSTNALIELKQSGVSAVVIKAIIGVGK